MFGLDAWLLGAWYVSEVLLTFASAVIVEFFPADLVAELLAFWVDLRGGGVGGHWLMGGVIVDLKCFWVKVLKKED